MMVRTGKVINNIDPDEKGKVQVRIFPELLDVSDNHLPWASPNIRTNIHSIPKEGSFIFVEINEDWTDFSYNQQSPYVSAMYPYEKIKENVDSASNSGSHKYPQPTALLMEDGSTYFHNEETGECGLIHSSGVHIILKDDGSFSMVQDGKIDLVYDASKKEFKIKDITDIELPDLTSLILGEGSDSLVLFETLKEILEKLLDHNHIAPTGPTLPAQESSGTPLSVQKSKLFKMKSEIVTSD